MLSNSVSWLIALIISTKSCVSSYDFTLNLKSVLPNLGTSLITKPIQGLQQAPKSAINLLQRSNPLSYLIPSNRLKNFNDEVNSSYTQNNANDSSYTRRKSTETEIPNIQYGPFTTFSFDKQNELKELSTQNIIDQFMEITEQLDRKFYQISFDKLSSISPPERQENGISFAQSGLLLYLQLMALCIASEGEIALEIKQSLGLKTTCKEQLELLKGIMDILPKSNNFLKFRWSSRFVLGSNVLIDEETIGLTSPALNVYLDQLNKTYSTEELTEHLNHMIEIDSGWAMQDTFEEEELSNGICAAWLTTMYLRPQWRSAPTVLNGTRLFHDGTNPSRTVRMIRINDVARYASIQDWDAEAIEIRYATPELTLMILLPRGRSLRKLSESVCEENIRNIYKKMETKRIAVILPIYTLRMILLLPGKLETMGISRLVDSNAGATCQSVKLSHSVQRIMFWAEAGRNAFKDDGIEWNEHPELEVVVDRPYIFFVRWQNITLLNGNFVL